MLLTSLLVFSLVVLAHFALANSMLLIMGVVAAGFLWEHRIRHTRRTRSLSNVLVSPPLVSIIVPARNEALTIVESVRALLALEYKDREIVVVNDGSTDDTLARLIWAFQLVFAPVVYPEPVKTAPVCGVYRSMREPALVVVDKHSGGCKSDASNAGLNAASGDLVLIIDADTVLEPDGLSRAVLPFLEDPHIVGIGANVGLANGCGIEDGRVSQVALPRNWLARFQIVEYMRVFLLFRLACAAVNGVPIISGAFGLFRRDAIVAIGGYDTTSIGEDMDLTVRLHRYYRERREPYRITFDPNVLCWTQAPEDLASLRNQRWRWRRGLVQVLWRQRRMIGNPRFGTLGAAVLPFILLTEGIGPFVEMAGYLIATVAALAGLLDWRHYGLLIAVSLLFGWAATLLAVLLSDIATRRYMRGRDLAMLVIIAVLENLGYRQLNSWWSCVGTMQAMTGKGGWGAMRRRAFEGRNTIRA
jgi:cellulose synthase/poly-beta-1,6-N-acetylglucosamine synthase-like glycosyltransferase